jgi:hypothetical protein
MKNTPSPWRPDARDLLALIGLALLAYGLWLVYPPSAFIVPGTMLFGIAVFR